MKELVSHLGCQFTRAAAFLAFCTSTTGWAQAWVDKQGSLTAGIAYSFRTSSSIIETEGKSIDDLSITQHAALFAVEYVSLENLAASLSLPIIGVSVDGDAPGNLGYDHGPFDGGGFALRATDLRLDIRYMLIEDPVAFGVGIGGSTPITKYPTSGSSALGRGLKAVYFNAAAGAVMPFLPNLYAHVRYEFALVERVSSVFQQLGDIDQNRSAMSAQLGYYIIPEFEVNISLDWQFNHDGINFVDFRELSAVERDFHDVLQKERTLFAGLGVGYAPTDYLSLNLFGQLLLSAANTLNGPIIGGAISWTVL